MRPTTTLFMLTSVDGKISTGNSELLDFDTDLTTLEGVKEGLHQYYEFEQQSELWSFNTGRVMDKIGVNSRREDPQKSPVSFVILDNQPHLKISGIRYLCKWVKHLIIVTTNPNHPACLMDLDNLSVILQTTLDLPKLFEELYLNYQIERMTIQSGGTMNGNFMREKLIDYLDIVIAPILVGGKDTPSLIDGASITSTDELNKLALMKLQSCDVLSDSYLRLRYQIVNP